MSKLVKGSKVGVVEDGKVCEGIVTDVEDGMCDIDFPDGDDGTYPVEKVKLIMDSTAPVTETAALASLRAEMAKLRQEIKATKGIPDAQERTKIGEQPRVDALMKKHLKSALVKTRENMTDAEVISVERTIRKYVKKGGLRKNVKDELANVKGGFRKGLSAEDIAYAKILLSRMGRDPDKPDWDESILVPGFSDTLKGVKPKL